MTPFKIVLTFSLILVTTLGFSQKMSQKQKEREQNKVNIHTSKENDNLQRFYAEEVDKMRLSDEKREEYYNILLSHTYDMSRLDDKDKDYTETEITEKFNAVIDKMNIKMKELLTPEQYVMHLETFSKIIYSVNRKRALNKN